MISDRRRNGLLLLVSPILPIVLMIVAAILVRANSEFSVNDDWQYAHIAKRLAETGIFSVDRPIAPALIVQSYLGALLIKLVGFSFRGLRVLTFVVAVIGFVVLDRSLARVKVSAAIRAVTLTLLALNPLTFVNSLSFMTEYYGLTPALIAIAIWTNRPTGKLTVGRALIATCFGVTAYLTRQFCGLVIPALCLAGLAELGEHTTAKDKARYFSVLATSALVFIASVLTHLLWIKATGNEPSALENPLNGLLKAKLPAWVAMGGLCLLYLNAFLVPLYVFLDIKDWRKTVLLGAGVVVAFILFAHGLELFYGRPIGAETSAFGGKLRLFNPKMPYLTNVIYEGGIGPATTTDAYLEAAHSGPHLPRLFWTIIGYVVAGLMFFVPIPFAAMRGLRDLTADKRRLILAAGTFGVMSLLFTLQTYGFEFFDRYLCPPLLGFAVVLAVLAPSSVQFRWPRLVLGAGVLTPIVLFTVMATHDYFGWQTARWRIYTRLLDQGISPLSIDAGWEPNGWFAYDEWKSGVASQSCVSSCVCRSKSPWFCADDSYRIGFVPRRGDLTIERLAVRGWLASSTMLVASRRPDP